MNIILKMIAISNSIDQFLNLIKDINLSIRQQQSIGVITAAVLVTSYSIYKIRLKVRRLQSL